ncbi:TetR/AcrR family transcriptional regulator [Pseudoclavibacter chungangensis]|uniref:TetR/AcrR family transcriptional regulator n=1 Tax=Pseudoclavibacter chungangensis TaxID=587635 RepID=A0A7J5BPU5_9MICO|nr:TetR family transcriptional regulator [Pseudoclavibacter chungangensis]KAB1655376.1 TetR/AcrR family transcriptional regulator [Pseudoclavibacter chungangensis]NYJ68328.1 AcrR family transcriptional regulator [Pseudoclavibacter chungangensis]
MITQVRALETRRTIIATASEVFLEWGYAATSLAEIAERAGVTKGALAFHFASKAELARATVTHQRDASVAFVKDVEAFDGDRLQPLQEMRRRLAERLVDDTALRAASDSPSSNPIWVTVRSSAPFESGCSSSPTWSRTDGLVA